MPRSLALLGGEGAGASVIDFQVLRVKAAPSLRKMD